MDKYEKHKMIYDIVDESVHIRNEMLKLSKLIDLDNNTPNSLQALLGMIYRYEGLSQYELSKIYNLDLKNLTKSVRQLEKRGLIIKKIDGVKKPIYLTDEGKEKNDLFMKSRGNMIDFIMSNVKNEDLEKTKLTLKLISELMQDYIEIEFK